MELESNIRDRITYLRYACMHCENPSCLCSCPNEAIYQRTDGIVLVDHEVCEGSHDCVFACPYGAIDINPEANYFADQ